MSFDPAGSLRYRSFFGVLLVLAAMLPPSLATAGRGPHITVMTQNLYLGTRLNDTFEASSWWELVSAVSEDWSNVLANDFPTRARVLSEEIVRTRPEVVGLQEVTLWREQSPGDLLAHPTPNATLVALDFLAILQRELSLRGVPYTAVATSTNADVEAPRLGPGGSLVDLRITDRDVLMVRDDVAGRVSNPMEGHYTAQLTVPFLTGPVRSTRGWTSIDYRLDRQTTVRIFNTHLEVGPAGAGTVQELQGTEVLAIVAASPHPVIALGDFNSPADGSGTDTYQHLTAPLEDAWASARPADSGSTCCQAELLSNAVGREHARIDLVLTSEDWPVTRVARTGAQPFRAGPPPLWASDHSGVTARIAVPRQ